MSYKWKGMRKLTWEEVKKRLEKGELAGCFKLYCDNTEAAMGPLTDLKDIERHRDNGGEFGEEIDNAKLFENKRRKLEFELMFGVFVSGEDLDDIMTSALEGGINYWCNKVEVMGGYLGEYASEQISRGGILRLYDFVEGNWEELTREKLIKGLKKYIMKSATSDICEFINHELIIDSCLVDADVADAIVQYAVFGNIVYG